MLTRTPHKLSATATEPLAIKLHEKCRLKLLVIGHRGVGKTCFLTRLTPFLKKQDVTVCHLDQEVEKQTQKSIRELFKERGEGFFRDCEIRCFSSLIEKYKDKNLVIDLGAGFSGEKPENFKALWLQRAVNLSEAFFLDRPELENSPKISMERFQQRQDHYQSIADYELELPEDKFGDETPLKKFFEKSFLQMGEYSFKGLWFLTRLHDNHNATVFLTDQRKFIDQDAKNPGNKAFQVRSSPLQELCNVSDRNFCFQREGSPLWELRNDLLSFLTIKRLIKEHPESLISFRKKEESRKLETLLDNDSLWDWPLEWGLNREAGILSLHKRKDSLSQTLNQLPCGDQIIKLAVPIRDFSELKLGYEWFRESPGTRVFLPTSPSGRWKWFRLLTAGKMPFGFFREARSPNPDQPTLMDILNYRFHWSSFAAIVGSPVNHSLTPSFHRHFFKEKQMNCFAIDLLKEEWEQAFPFLDEMGLKSAAVTSPLKKKAAEWMGQKSSTHSSLIINTLFKSWESWLATSTDDRGFKKLISGCENKKVVVWGGGDILDLIKRSCFQVVFYSSRTGQSKGESQRPMEPDILIWAVGPENFRKKGVYPPKHWKPEKVIDLNYNIDSPGLVCANRYGCQYQSGLVMFTEQAKKQQEFWNECYTDRV